MSFPYFTVLTKNEVKIYIQRELAVSRCIVAALLCWKLFHRTQRSV